TNHLTISALRCAFHERQSGGGRGYSEFRGDHAARAQVLELGKKCRSHFLPLGDQQSALSGTNLLLDDHSGCKQLNSALSDFTFFGVWIQFHQSLEKVRTETLVLTRKLVHRFIARGPVVDEVLVGQRQPQDFRSKTNVGRCSIGCTGRRKRTV